MLSCHGKNIKKSRKKLDVVRGVLDNCENFVTLTLERIIFMRENLHIRKTTASYFFDQLKIKVGTHEKCRQEICKMFDEHQLSCEDNIVNRL